MDPATHALIGIALSKFGGNAAALSDQFTVAAALGAVIPDADILLQKWGDCVYLKNHRGPSHSIIGIVVSAVVITAVLSGVYGTGRAAAIFLWALAGSVSHVLIDLLNSFGAKILWPFTRRKFGLGVLITFDPFLMGTLAGYILIDGPYKYVCMGLFAGYIAVRTVMRFMAKSRLKKEFTQAEGVYIFPSFKGLFRWHFVVENNDCTLVGEKTMMRNRTRVLQRLGKAEDKIVNTALDSRVGVFFSEFTPLFHVLCEKVDGITKFKFIDLRYYIKGNFLHRAELEVDDKGTELCAFFNPYSSTRRCTIP